jgi:hypothetical protein
MFKRITWHVNTAIGTWLVYIAEHILSGDRR